MLDHAGVVAFPHLGASTPESEDNCARMAVQELVDYLEHGNIRNSVNLPAAAMPPSALPRICVIHRNIPTLISQISTDLGGLNIENMLNKSRGDYAYTMLDVNQKPDDATVAKLNAIEGVIRVRVIG